MFSTLTDRWMRAIALSSHEARRILAFTHSTKSQDEVDNDAEKAKFNEIIDSESFNDFHNRLKELVTSKISSTVEKSPEKLVSI